MSMCMLCHLESDEPCLPAEADEIDVTRQELEAVIAMALETEEAGIPVPEKIWEGLMLIDSQLELLEAAGEEDSFDPDWLTTNITDEKTRVYFYGDGNDPVVIDDPQAVTEDDDGFHYIEASDGGGPVWITVAPGWTHMKAYPAEDAAVL